MRSTPRAGAPGTAPATDAKSRRALGLGLQRSSMQMIKIDTNNNGLDYDEFFEYLRVQLEGTPELDELLATPKTTIRLWFDCLDFDKDGLLNKSQLFGFALKQGAASAGHRNVSKLLKSYPELTGGPITLPALDKFVQQYGFDYATASQIMSAIDLDKNGKLTLGELDTWAKTVMKNDGGVKMVDGTKPL